VIVGLCDETKIGHGFHRGASVCVRTGIPIRSDRGDVKPGGNQARDAPGPLIGHVKGQLPCGKGDNPRFGDDDGLPF